LLASINHGKLRPPQLLTRIVEPQLGRSRGQYLAAYKSSRDFAAITIISGTQRQIISETISPISNFMQHGIRRPSLPLQREGMAAS